jgi:hypothetical protein
MVGKKLRWGIYIPLRFHILVDDSCGQFVRSAQQKGESKEISDGKEKGCVGHSDIYNLSQKFLRSVLRVSPTGRRKKMPRRGGAMYVTQIYIPQSMIILAFNPSDRHNRRGNERDEARKRFYTHPKDKLPLEEFLAFLVTLKEEVGRDETYWSSVFEKVVQMKEMCGGKEKARSQSPDRISATQISISQSIHSINRAGPRWHGEHRKRRRYSTLAGVMKGSGEEP